MKEKLGAKLTKIGINATEEDLERFEIFYNFLIEENQKYNLTGITDEDEVIDKHFIDSLMGAAFLQGGDRVIDVGSGAGFPSIPLAIIKKDCHFTLVDSLNKRVNFLTQATEKLGLKNVTAIHSRAEDLSRHKHREHYNVALARAVAPLNTLAEYCLPFCCVGGRFVAYKTEDETELKNAQNAIKILGGKITEIKKFTLPDTDINRTIIIIEKRAKTPPEYPRGKNKEKSSPL